MNEFIKILEYLEKEEKKIKTEDFAKPIKAEVKADPQPNFNIKEIKTKTNIQSDDYIEVQLNKNDNEIIGFDIDKFVKLMKNELIKDFNKSKNFKKATISVTELLSCPRKFFYNKKNFPIDKGHEEFKLPSLYLIRKVGNLVHSEIQKLYSFDEFEKTIISQNFHIKGRLDAILGKSLIEIKTVDDPDILEHYDINHYNQGVIYTYILNTEYNYNINNISIFYLFRDLKTMKVYNIPPDLKLGKSFCDKSLMIFDCLEKNIVPIASINNSKDECKYCGYKIKCKSEKSESPEKLKHESKFLL